MRIILKKIKTSRGEGYIMKCTECDNVFRIKKWDYENLNKGKFCSNKCKGIFQSKNFNGKNNPNWKDGKVQIRCKECKKRKMVKRKDIKNKRGKYCSKECKDIDNSRVMKEYYKKYPEHKEKTKCTGNKNGRWLDGKSFEPYSAEFTDELRELIRKRDNYTCQECSKSQNDNIKEFGCKLSVHHIDYDKKNCQENNLISLCNKCHSKTNCNRKYWEKYLSNLI